MYSVLVQLVASYNVVLHVLVQLNVLYLQKVASYLNFLQYRSPVNIPLTSTVLYMSPLYCTYTTYSTDLLYIYHLQYKKGLLYIYHLQYRSPLHIPLTVQVSSTCTTYSTVKYRSSLHVPLSVQYSTGILCIYHCQYRLTILVSHLQIHGCLSPSM